MFNDFRDCNVKQALNKAFFVISLDTELKWGYRFYPDHEMAEVLENEENGIDSIIAFLNLFEKYNIPVTWSIVGKLFFENYEDIIEKIISSPVEHEIGYHSFSHVNFLKCDNITAEHEINKIYDIQKDYKISFKTFVYPENKIGYVDLLKKNNFLLYRGPNLAGKNVNRSLPIRTWNFLTSKLIAPTTVPIWKEGIWELPTSMLFNDNLFPQTLVFRSKQGIKKAIKENKIFHIYLHPEDIILKPNLIDKLEEVLKFVKIKERKKEIEVKTMAEIALILEKKCNNQFLGE